MPLRCLDRDGTSVHAFALGAAAWDALAAENRRTRTLSMPCCAARVSVKRSALGMQFFAHVGRGGCTTGDESPEHLALKQLAVDAARAHGWQAETEVAAADGSWRADVLAARGRHRVAVEVQWSPQADDETLLRQAQYAAAGVRALWLFRQRNFPATADVPALRVEGSLAKGFTIGGAGAVTALEGVFDRRLSFGFAVGSVARARLIGGVAKCWGRDCGSLTRIVTAIELACLSSCCTLDVADLTPNALATGGLIAAVPRGDANGRIRLRCTGGGPMLLTNGCFGCDRILDSRRVSATTRSILATVEVRIDPEFAALIAGHPRAQPAWGVRVAPAEPTR